MGDDDRLIQESLEKNISGSPNAATNTKMDDSLTTVGRNQLDKNSDPLYNTSKDGKAVGPGASETMPGENNGKNVNSTTGTNSGAVDGSNAPSSSGSSPSSSGSAPDSSGSSQNADATSDDKGSGIGSKLAGAALNKIAGDADPDSVAGQVASGAQKAINIVGKVKWIIACAPALFLALIIIICICGVIGFILGPADTVIQFFRDGWDSLKTLVGYKKDEEWELEYYQKLDEVQEDLNKKYGVCIDINLITATLTVDMGTDQYVREGQETEVDTPDGSELGLTGDDYKKMIKQVELLGNMQIRRSVYGLDNQWKTTNPFTGEEIKYCSNPETEADQQEKLITTQEDIDRFALDKPIFSRVINNWLSRFGYAADGIPVRISEPVRQVARNDLDGGIFTFFTKRANEERNIAYYLYRPPFEIKEYDDNGNKLQTPTVTCNEEPKSDPTGHDFAVLDVGDFNDMENNIYYWNLMDSFIVDYYKDYLPSNGGDPFEPGTESYEKVKKIVSDIYLLYHEMGPSRMCDAVYKNECIYEFDDNGGNIGGDGSLSTSAGMSNVNVQLTQCQNGKTPIAGVLPMSLEDYIKGVVAAEIRTAYGNYEAVKAQAVAARTYVLLHYDDKEVMDDGSTLLKIQNCNYKQVYTDPVIVYNEAGEKVYQEWLNALKEVEGQVLTGDNGLIENKVGETYLYTSKEQNEWINSSLDYRSMLMSTYSNANDLYSNCTMVGGGNGTGEGTTPGHSEAILNGCSQNMESDKDLWDLSSLGKFNSGQCTNYAYGRTLQILQELGWNVNDAKSYLNYVLEGGQGLAGQDGAVWVERNSLVTDPSKRFSFERTNGEYDEQKLTDMLKIADKAIISWKGPPKTGAKGVGGYHCYDPRGCGHVAIIESVEVNPDGSIKAINITETAGAGKCSERRFTNLKDFFYRGKYDYFDGIVYLN